jgi:hypothetical protein
MSPHADFTVHFGMDHKLGNLWLDSDQLYIVSCLQLKDEDVAIVKMDATSNDVSGSYEVHGFPTLYWAPKDAKDSPVRYEVSVLVPLHMLRVESGYNSLEGSIFLKCHACIQLQ